MKRAQEEWKHDIVYDPKGQNDLNVGIDLLYNLKGHNPKGCGELFGRFDLFHDTKRSQDH